MNTSSRDIKVTSGKRFSDALREFDKAVAPSLSKSFRQDPNLIWIPISPFFTGGTILFLNLLFNDPWATLVGLFLVLVSIVIVFYGPIFLAYVSVFKLGKEFFDQNIEVRSIELYTSSTQFFEKVFIEFDKDFALSYVRFRKVTQKYYFETIKFIGSGVNLLALLGLYNTLSKLLGLESGPQCSLKDISKCPDLSAFVLVMILVLVIVVFTYYSALNIIRRTLTLEILEFMYTDAYFQKQLVSRDITSEPSSSTKEATTILIQKGGLEANQFLLFSGNKVDAKILFEENKSNKLSDES